MYPILWETSYFTVHAYGFMISLAILISAFFLLREAPAAGYNPDHILEAVIVLGVSGLLGSRVLYILLNFSYYMENWRLIPDLRVGGLSFYGAIIFGFLALLFWARWRKLALLPLADFFAPYLMFGYVFGRIGCFLNGCCYGKITESVIGMPAAFTDNFLRHPVQLYAALLALLFFFTIIYLRKFSFFEGYVLILLLLFYGILRFSTGFFRYDALMVIGLSPAQIVSLLLVLVMVVLLFFKKKTISRDEKENGGN